MDPTQALTMVGGISVALVVAVAILIAASRQKTKATSADDRTLEALCKRHPGLQLTLGSMVQPSTVKGTVGKAQVSLSFTSEADAISGNRRSVVELAVSAPGSLSDGIVIRRGQRTSATIPGGRRLRTTDEVFDEAYIARSAHAATMLSHLDADARDALVKAQHTGWRLEFGRWTCRMSDLPDVAQLDERLQQGLAVLESTHREGTVAEVLERMAHDDPLPSVRAVALQQRLTTGRAASATLRRLASRDEPVAVVAARALRSDGLANLERLSRLPTTTREALLALAELDDLPPATRQDCEERLVALLARDEGRLQVIDALGLIALPTAVPALAPFAEGGFLGSRQKEKANDAIRRIQARAVGAEAGQVSIVAPAETGKLSVAAAREAGRVSQTER